MQYNECDHDQCIRLRPLKWDVLCKLHASSTSCWTNTSVQGMLRHGCYRSGTNIHESSNEIIQCRVALKPLIAPCRTKEVLLHLIWMPVCSTLFVLYLQKIPPVRGSTLNQKMARVFSRSWAVITQQSWQLESSERLELPFTCSRTSKAKRRKRSAWHQKTTAQGDELALAPIGEIINTYRSQNRLSIILECLFELLRYYEASQAYASASLTTLKIAKSSKGINDGSKRSLSTYLHSGVNSDNQRFTAKKFNLRPCRQSDQRFTDHMSGTSEVRSLVLQGGKRLTLVSWC